MHLVLIVLAVAGLVGGQSLKPLVDFCANPPKTPPKTLSDKMALPEAYKISGSITDWLSSSTSLLTETGTKGLRVLEKASRDQKPMRWIMKDAETRMVNVTSGTCDANATRPALLPEFSKILGDSSSLFAVVQSLIEFDKSHSGFDLPNEEIVGGVNAISWVSCINGSSNFIVEVRYGGENTIRPAHGSFSNPLLISVRFTELSAWNISTALHDVSIELDRYELPTSNGAIIEHGIVCSNENSSVPLPLKPIDEYAAVLNYQNYVENRSEVIEVLYSKTRKLFILAGDSFEKNPTILKSKMQYGNGTDYILHDFAYGYEFVMAKGACQQFSALRTDTADVVPLQNGSFGMMPMETLLVESAISWNQYDSDTDTSGSAYRSYRSFDPRTESVIEAQLTENGELHSVNTFKNGKLAMSLSITRMPADASRLRERSVQLSDCYDDGKFANNTWIVQIKDKKLIDVAQVGVSRLNEAVVESIAKNVHPVIPYRIVVFYVENQDTGVSLVMRIAEKTAQQPAPVGYNLTNGELSTLELFRMMNSTMFLEKMPIVVEKVGGVREEWMADAKTLKTYPPPADSGFLGYTGGAMFVLAIFCLLIGVSIGAVGVFVATRRQRISTLAYQVFE